MNLWPHQQTAVKDTLDAIERGARRVCITSPTGGGKTRIACALIDQWIEAGKKVALYTNRRALVEQTARVLDVHGITHGVRAASYESADEPFAQVQVCSVQTENARCFQRNKWTLHPADRVIVDEAHIQKGDIARKILATHAEAGAAYVGLTATPLDIGDLYDELILAGTPSELRKCGALVPAIHYGPDEPDLKQMKIAAPEGADFTQSQQSRAIMTPTIFGRVLSWYNQLNEERRPTILFAPGVSESLWFAQQFAQAGITSAHIDGDDTWINGSLRKTDSDARRAVLEGSERGQITVICNRYVLREGIDTPWLSHGILATVFGSLQSYLQAGGRLLRKHPSHDHVTIQDHGGNWWRHGSLNTDREWNLAHTGAIVTGLRADRFRAKKELEPRRCSACGLIFTMNTKRCPRCGSERKEGKFARPVVQLDGTMREMRGDIFRPHRVTQKANGPQIWEKMYHRSRTEKGRRTFRAAAALFAQENNWGWPDPTWPLMPKDPFDWYRNVEDVPRERLT